MAAGFLRRDHPEWDVYSAGTHPAAEVHPVAVKVMGEMGIDLSREQPQSVEPLIQASFDHVITVCDEANETCPVFVGEVRHRHHFGFPDPAKATGTDDQIEDKFRTVQDNILRTFTEFGRSLESSE